MFTSYARAAGAARATIILAARDAARRKAFASALEETSLAVAHTVDAAGLVNAVRQAHARLVVLDLALGQADTLSCIRVMKRNPQTRDVPILVICRPATDVGEVHELITAGAGAVLPATISATGLLERVERALDAAPASDVTQHSSAATMHVPDNASLLMRPLRCGFHPAQQPFSYYLLRAGRVAVDVNFHDVPIYAPSGDSPFVDYHVLSVIVCPVCHFASADPEYFQQPGNVRAEPFPFDAPTRAAIVAAQPERAALAQRLSLSFATHERSLADALLAHELAIATAQTLTKANLHTFARELVRIGNYHLRAALLAEQLGATVETVQQRQRMALKVFMDAYVYSEGATYFRNAYQIVALAITFGDDATAYQYLARLREAAKSKPAANDERAVQERYLTLAQKAWEDREYRRAATPA